VVRDHLPPAIPDGTLGIATVLLLCGAGAVLAITAGVESAGSVVVAVVVAIAASIVIKIRADMVTSKAVTAVSRGDLEPEAAPVYVQARLASARHRNGLGKALRRIAGDAARYPRKRMISPPPLVLHFEPETRDRLRELAEVLESPEPLALRGVAMAEELVTNPVSPLFGESDEDVEIELRRVLYTLASK
jgi:hypothetical protein